MSPSDQHHLQAAQGWLELGDWKSADEELEKIDAEFRLHPDVLELRWNVHAKAENWSWGADVGKVLIEVAPDRATSWIHYAFALHALKQTRQAFELLSPVAIRFPTEWIIPYNLACYSCQLGDLIGARDWLAQAFRLGDAKEIKLRALDDPDLEPLSATG